MGEQVMNQINTKLTAFSVGLKSFLSMGIVGSLAMNVAQAEDAILVPPAPKTPEVMVKKDEKKPTVQKAKKFVFPSPVVSKPIFKSNVELPKITPRPKLALAPKVKIVKKKQSKPPKNSTPWTVMIVPAQKMDVPESEQLAVAAKFYIDNNNGNTVGENEVSQFTVDNKTEDTSSVSIQPRIDLVPSHESAEKTSSSSCCSGDLNASNYLEIYKSIPFNHAEYLANPAYRHEATMSMLLGQQPTKSIHNHYRSSVYPVSSGRSVNYTVPLYNNPEFRWNGYPYRRHLPYQSNARFYSRNYFYTNPYRFSGYWTF